MTNRDRTPNLKPNPHLRFENVSLKAPLGPHYLLKAITFSIVEGDRLAIVGPIRRWQNIIATVDESLD